MRGRAGDRPQHRGVLVCDADAQPGKHAYRIGTVKGRRLLQRNQQTWTDRMFETGGQGYRVSDLQNRRRGEDGGNPTREHLSQADQPNQRHCFTPQNRTLKPPHPPVTAQLSVFVAGKCE